MNTMACTMATMERISFVAFVQNFVRVMACVSGFVVKRRDSGVPVT